MASVWYCTREGVKSALDSKETARNNVQVDRAIASSTQAIDEQMHRRFTPVVDTRYFDWPPLTCDGELTLYLDDSEVIEITSLSVSGTAMVAGTDYVLEPVNTGPPYERVRLLSTGAAAAAYDGIARWAITIVGKFGYRDDEEVIGALAANLNSGSSSTATVSWTGARFGVGDILRIDDERLIITNRTMVDSTQNLGGSGLTASASAVTVAVSNGTGFAVDEVILVESERMLIVDIAGNNLTVKRGWDGSVLAAHAAGVDIYALTGVELARGQLGTTDADHLSGATIYRFIPPPLINQLAIAESITSLMQENSGYGRTVGSGESQRQGAGKSLEDLRDMAYRALGRKAF